MYDRSTYYYHMKRPEGVGKWLQDRNTLNNGAQEEQDLQRKGAGVSRIADEQPTVYLQLL